jgi:hypothetical protein
MKVGTGPLAAGLKPGFLGRLLLSREGIFRSSQIGGFKISLVWEICG